MTANTGRTTSRIIRSRLRPRRSSQLFFGDGPVFVSGDVRASGAGTIFKAFSLMIYPTFACCWFALRAIAERRLFFNCTELLEHALDRSRRDSVKHGFHHVRAKIRQTVEQRSCCRLQVQTIGARRSFGSARRSMSPLSASRSRSRVRLIGCRSSRSASSDCFRPSCRSMRFSTAHCAREMPNLRAR
jgi:hypothetical protein